MWSCNAVQAHCVRLPKLKAVNTTKPMKIRRTSLARLLTAGALTLAAVVNSQAAVTVIGYYRMGENDPGAVAGNTVNATNTAAVGGNLTAIGTPMYSSNVSPVANTAAGSTLSTLFNGSTDGYSGTTIDTGSDNFGMECWVNAADLSGNPIVVLNGNGGSGGCGLLGNAGQMAFLYAGTAIYNFNTQLALNTWYHIAAVKDNGVTTLYLNGVADGTANCNPFVSGQLLIGRDASDGFFHGLIDEVRIFNFAPGAFSTNDLLYYQVYVPPTKVSTPVFGPPGGTLIGAQSVTISSDTGAKIYYTTNGSTPTSSSAVYSAPIIVPANSSMTIKAYATKSGLADSLVASASFVTVTSMAEAVWVNPAGGSWTNAANWSNSVAGNGRGITADFSKLTLTAEATNTLDGRWTIGNLLFGDVGNTYGWILNGGAAGSLTLDSATAPTITVNNLTTTIGASLAGVSGLTKAGSGTLALGGANSYTGNTTIEAGTLAITIAANLP